MPMPPTEEREIQELKKITEELHAVNVNTGSSWVAFWRGVLQGGGAVVGSILAIILIGIVLSILGFIPGVRDISAYVASVVAHLQRW